jgi:hypothetical protein
MKKTIMTASLVFFMAATLGACAVERNPAHTTVYTPTGAYDYHCPPGQAKKGNC